MDDNTLRYDPHSQCGHVESYFIRANHPSLPLAFWLKSTILSPRLVRSAHRSPIAEKWCIFFDGERRRIFSKKEMVPIKCGMRNAECGMKLGQVEGCAWDLSWENKHPSTLGKPLCLYPSRRWVHSFFPASKLLTPFPALCFNGTFHVFGEEFSIQNWWGMQGHNWGKRHPEEYAWGQCLFHDARGEPDCMVEGFTGRVRVAGMMTPWLSSVVVRRNAQEYRFDGLWNFWRQKALIEHPNWKVRLVNPTATLELEMQAPSDSFAHLLYENPDGTVADCFNSKLSHVRMVVHPQDEEPFEYRSEHGGALEFLRPKVTIQPF